ncbi:MAG: hypothetical protein A2133_01420 [Actinobacteria bacterium RBG_16_64_13]|nr:MAG: hypothetical protein A2133_01420 [Actinobacteria bacterium RBG_16_64_13]
MGLFDFLKGSPTKAGATAAGPASAGAAATGAAAEESAIGSLLGAGGANLWGLLEKLKAAGLEDKVMSWIGRGENKPISPDEVKAGVPADQIEAVAAKLGISRDVAASKIAAILPGLIDKLTPDGLVPDPAALANKLSGILKL